MSLETGVSSWSQRAQIHNNRCNSIVGKFTSCDTVWKQVAQYLPSIIDDSTANKQVNHHVYHFVRPTFGLLTSLGTTIATLDNLNENMDTPCSNSCKMILTKEGVMPHRGRGVHNEGDACSQAV